jgi:hypothetical protein
VCTFDRHSSIDRCPIVARLSRYITNKGHHQSTAKVLIPTFIPRRFGPHHPAHTYTTMCVPFGITHSHSFSIICHPRFTNSMSSHLNHSIGKGKARQLSDSNIRDYGAIELSELSKRRCAPHPSIDGILSPQPQSRGPSRLTPQQSHYCKTRASSNRAGQMTGDIADEWPQSIEHNCTHPHPHTDDSDTAHIAPPTNAPTAPQSLALDTHTHEGSWYTRPLNSAKAFERPIRRAIENTIEDPFERRKTQVYTSLHRSIQPRLPKPPEDCCGPDTTIPGMCHSCCYTTCGCDNPPADPEGSVVAEVPANLDRPVQYSRNRNDMSYCSPSEDCLLPCKDDDGSRCTKGYQEG